MKRLAFVVAVLALTACKAKNEGATTDTAAPAMAPAPATTDTAAATTPITTDTTKTADTTKADTTKR